MTHKWRYAVDYSLKQMLNLAQFLTPAKGFAWMFVCIRVAVSMQIQMGLL